MTARALMMGDSVICARSHKKSRFLPIFYDVSIARKIKVNSGFSGVALGKFFENFAHFEIQTLSLIYPYLKKISAQQFRLMAKNKKSRDIGETV